MYRPYVGSKNVRSTHLPTILDVEIEHTAKHHAFVWCIAIAATLGLALALWYGQIPFQ